MKKASKIFLVLSALAAVLVVCGAPASAQLAVNPGQVYYGGGFTGQNWGGPNHVPGGYHNSKLGWAGFGWKGQYAGGISLGVGPSGNGGFMLQVPTMKPFKLTW